MDYQGSNKDSQGDLSSWLKAIPLQYNTYGKAISDLKDQLESSAKKIDELEKKIQHMEQIERRAAQSLNSMQRDMKNVRNKTLEPLAVFVGLFTFASVSFGTLSNMDASLWIIVLLIIAGMMVIFAGLVIHAGSLESDDRCRRYWTAGLIGVGLIILLVGVFFHFCTI
jgi:hypothetical protein